MLISVSSGYSEPHCLFYDTDHILELLYLALEFVCVNKRHKMFLEEVLTVLRCVATRSVGNHLKHATNDLVKIGRYLDPAIYHNVYR